MSNFALHCKRVRLDKTMRESTYSLENPALRTAVEIALMAVSREFKSRVRLPVAPVTFRCSDSTKRVSVIVSTSTSCSGSVGAGIAMAACFLIF